MHHDESVCKVGPEPFAAYNEHTQHILQILIELLVILVDLKISQQYFKLPFSV